MAEALRKRWVLILVLIVFICLKYSHLFHSFYWDESWPYASGVMQMYLHGPSLLPGSISGELARGHPLMFHFLGAIWMNVFGTSHVAMHAYPLFISVLFLVAIFEAGYRLFNIRVAIIALVLIASQEIFFVQSSFVLLEILTAFLGFISVFFYVTRRYVLTALSLFMLFYTKESGMVVGAILGIDAIIGLFRKELPVRQQIFRFVSLGVPVLLVAAFFIVQKQVSGWYVLPLYSNGLEHDYHSFYSKLRESFKLFFRNDNRKYLFVLLLALSVVNAIRQKKLSFALSLLAGLFIFLFVSDQYHDQIHGKALPVLVSASFLIVVYYMCSIAGFSDIQRKFIILLAFLVVSFAVFTSINLFFIDRYLLLAIVPVLFIGSVFISHYASNLSKRAFVPVLMIVLAINILAFAKDRNSGDTSIGAYDGLYVHEKLALYLERNNFREKSIASHGYLERIHLLDPYSGFLQENNPFKDVTWEITDRTEVVIFDNIEPDTRYDDLRKDSRFVRIYRVQKGEVWGEIYQRR